MAADKQWYCAGCQRVEIFRADAPTACLTCGASKSWRPVASGDPQVPWSLTENDKRFLSGVKIGAV